MPSGPDGASAQPSLNPMPTIGPAATLRASLPPGALDLSALGWQSVVQELDRTTQNLIGHWLAVGTLDSEKPAWYKPLTASPWRFQVFADQQPVVDGPAGGQVLYVSDNGVQSEIRVVDIHGVEAPLLGATPDVVYTARLSPNGQTAYLVLLERATGRDRGVFRVRLHGNGSIEQVMAPPTVDRAQAEDVIRLAATTRFVRTLRISANGSEVARLACGEPYGLCVLDVLQLADGRTRTFDNAGQAGDLVAIGDGVILGTDYCLPDGIHCVTDGLELASRLPQVFAGTPPAVDARGHLVMLQFPPPTVSARGFFLSNLDDSGMRLVFATDGSVRTIYQEGIFAEGVRLELPWGWVAVSLDRPRPDTAASITYHAAVRLTDGGWVRLTFPTLYPIGGATD